MLSNAEKKAFQKIKNKLVPNIDNLSPEEQDKLRIKMDKKLHKAACKWFYKHHFNYKYKPSDILNPDCNQPDLNPNLQFKLNKLTLLLTGIGENKFWLNEYLSKNQTLLSFKTLSDYDKTVHEEQEGYLVEDSNFPQYKTKKDYYVRLFSNWARAIIQKDNKETFQYLLIDSAASYIYQAVEEAASDTIDNLIPNTLEEGPNNGKKTKEGTIWDMQPNANGKEEELRMLQKLGRETGTNLYDELLTMFEEVALNCVWIIDRSEGKYDPSLHYIFSDSSSLDVRFTHWQADTTAKATRNISELDEIKEKYCTTITEILKKEYSEIPSTAS